MRNSSESALEILNAADNTVALGDKVNPEYPCPQCGTLQALPGNSPNRMQSDSAGYPSL
jgi:hypothetical protein